MFKIKLKFYCTLWLSVVSISEQDTQYADDHMGRQDKHKIMYLATDLVKDCLLKMRQLIEIRKEHEIFISYNVGIIIGRIREKYRNIMDIYNDIVNKGKDRSGVHPPGMVTVRPIHHIIAMEQIHYLSIEIDKLVHVLETAALEDLNTHALMVSSLMIPINMYMRTGTEREEEKKEDEEIDKIAEQEEMKSRMRQEYLMKKLGKPSNVTTTMKRFMRQWPVEKTWSLEGNYNNY